MMLARLKADSRHKSVVAFGGLEITRNAWVPVPPGAEGQALAYPDMETQAAPEPAEVLPAAIEPAQAEPAPEPPAVFVDRKRPTGPVNAKGLKQP